MWSVGVRATAVLGVMALCGAARAQDVGYTDTQMTQVNCVYMGILASDKAETISTLALSGRESTYGAEMLDEMVTPFVEACTKQYNWDEEQAMYARVLGNVSTAMNAQVEIARSAGATKDEVAQVMVLADRLPEDVRASLLQGARADDAVRAKLSAHLAQAGVKPAGGAMAEVVYVLELAARARDAQQELGKRLFS